MAKLPISRGLAYHLFCEPTARYRYLGRLASHFQACQVRSQWTAKATRTIRRQSLPSCCFTSALAGLVVHVACLKATAGFAKPPNPLSTWPQNLLRFLTNK